MTARFHSDEKILVERNMFFETKHQHILLSFVRSIAKSNEPEQLLAQNKVKSIFFEEHGKSLLLI